MFEWLYLEEEEVFRGPEHPLEEDTSPATYIPAAAETEGYSNFVPKEVEESTETYEVDRPRL